MCQRAVADDILSLCRADKQYSKRLLVGIWRQSWIIVGQELCLLTTPLPLMVNENGFVAGQGACN